MKARSLVVLLVLLHTTGCGENANPAGPLPVTRPRESATDGMHLTSSGTYPTYATEADIPTAYSIAEIYRLSPVVYWQGAYANASSAMSYYGNSGKQTLVLDLSKNGSSAGSTTGSSSDEHFLPGDYEMVTSGIGYQVSGTCGHVANLRADGDARIVLVVAIKGVTIPSEVFGSRSAPAAQPSCGTHSCTTVSSNDQSAYGGDYDPTEPATSTCDGGSSGSGTQYGVGDMTGGETVDWTTGIGNGGSSVCGQAAQVDYMCVEYYVEGEGWKDLGCGYVTTC